MMTAVFVIMCHLGDNPTEIINCPESGVSIMAIRLHHYLFISLFSLDCVFYLFNLLISCKIYVL